MVSTLLFDLGLEDVCLIPVRKDGGQERGLNWSYFHICDDASISDNGPVAALERPLPLLGFNGFQRGRHYRRENTLLVKQDISLPGAVLAAFAPLGGARCCFQLRMRLAGD